MRRINYQLVHLCEMRRTSALLIVLVSLSLLLPASGRGVVEKLGDIEQFESSVVSGWRRISSFLFHLEEFPKPSACLIFGVATLFDSFFSPSSLLPPSQHTVWCLHASCPLQPC